MPMYARIDGPYGLLPYDWHQYYQVVLIFGGIGITPGIAILKVKNIMFIIIKTDHQISICEKRFFVHLSVIKFRRTLF